MSWSPCSVIHVSLAGHVFSMANDRILMTTLTSRPVPVALVALVVSDRQSVVALPIPAVCDPLTQRKQIVVGCSEIDDDYDDALEEVHQMFHHPPCSWITI